MKRVKACTASMSRYMLLFMIFFSLNSCGIVGLIQGLSPGRQNPQDKGIASGQVVEQRIETTNLMGDNTQVATGKYTGAIQLPHLGIPMKDLKVATYFGGQQQVLPNGQFSIRMNNSALGIVSLQDQSGKSVMDIAFPKDPALKNRAPIFSPRTAAISLVFLQPGVIINDPLLATVLMRLIEKLPETRTLEDLIANKLKQDSYVLSKNDPDIIKGIDTATTALLDLADSPQMLEPFKTKAVSEQNSFQFREPFHIFQIPKNEENTPVFKDTTPHTDDAVNLQLDVDPQDLTQTELFYENTRSRWVAVYLSANGREEFINVIPPATLRIPKLTDLAWDVLTQAFGLVADLFAGKQDTILSRAENIVKSSFSNAEGSFLVSQLAGKSQSLLVTYGAGKNSQIDGKLAALWGLTILTEVLIPVASAVVDFDSARQKLLDKPTALPAIFECVTATVSSANDFISATKSLAESGNQKDYVAYFMSMTRSVIDLASSKHMSNNCKGTGLDDIIDNMLQKAIGSSLLKKLVAIDSAISALNAVIAVGKFIEIIVNVESIDRYSIHLGKTPSSPVKPFQPSTPPPASSQPKPATQGTNDIELTIE